MSVKIYIKKSLNVFFWCLDKISRKAYVKFYPKYLNWLGIKIDTLIYGAGKGIFRSFEDFDLCVEPYMQAEGNQIFYFGDLDYEGIGIYENLAELFNEGWKIIPFMAGYEKLLDKAVKAVSIPETKERQNRNIKNIFFSYFSTERIKQMKEILEKGRYVPQEILNISDF